MSHCLAMDCLDAIRNNKMTCFKKLFNPSKSIIMLRGKCLLEYVINMSRSSQYVGYILNSKKYCTKGVTRALLHSNVSYVKALKDNNFEFEHPAFLAAYENNCNYFKDHMTTRAELLSLVDSNGYNIIHYAVCQNNWDVLDCLKLQDRDFMDNDSTIEHGVESPVALAVYLGYARKLAKNVNVFDVDYTGRSLLHYAILGGTMNDTDFNCLIRDSYASTNCYKSHRGPDSFKGEGTLHAVIRSKNPKYFAENDVLCGFRVSPEQYKYYVFKRSLSWDVKEKNVADIKVDAYAGSPYDSIDMYGHTAEMIAVMHGNKEFLVESMASEVSEKSAGGNMSIPEREMNQRPVHAIKYVMDLLILAVIYENFHLIPILFCCLHISDAKEDVTRIISEYDPSTSHSPISVTDILWNLLNVLNCNFKDRTDYALLFGFAYDNGFENRDKFMEAFASLYYDCLGRSILAVATESNNLELLKSLCKYRFATGEGLVRNADGPLGVANRLGVDMSEFVVPTKYDSPILTAVTCGVDCSVVDFVLENIPGSCDAKDSNGNPVLLFEAIRFGSFEVGKHLMELSKEETQIHCRGVNSVLSFNVKEDRTPDGIDYLQMAAMCGNIRIFNMLQQFVDFAVTLEMRRNFIVLAVWNGHVTFVGHLSSSQFNLSKFVLSADDAKVFGMERLLDVVPDGKINLYHIAGVNSKIWMLNHLLYWGNHLHNSLIVDELIKFHIVLDLMEPLGYLFTLKHSDSVIFFEFAVCHKQYNVLLALAGLKPGLPLDKLRLFSCSDLAWYAISFDDMGLLDVALESITSDLISYCISFVLIAIEFRKLKFVQYVVEEAMGMCFPSDKHEKYYSVFSKPSALKYFGLRNDLSRIHAAQLSVIGFAAIAGDVSVFKYLLLRMGINTDEELHAFADGKEADRDGDTSNLLVKACMGRDNLELVTYLVNDRHFPVMDSSRSNAGYGNTYSYLSAAIFSGSLGVVDFLVKSFPLFYNVDVICQSTNYRGTRLMEVPLRSLFDYAMYCPLIDKNRPLRASHTVRVIDTLKYLHEVHGCKFDDDVFVLMLKYLLVSNAAAEATDMTVLVLEYLQNVACDQMKKYVGLMLVWLGCSDESMLPIVQFLSSAYKSSVKLTDPDPKNYGNSICAQMIDSGCSPSMFEIIRKEFEVSHEELQSCRSAPRKSGLGTEDENLTVGNYSLGGGNESLLISAIKSARVEMIIALVETYSFSLAMAVLEKNERGEDIILTTVRYGNVRVLKYLLHPRLIQSDVELGLYLNDPSIVDNEGNNALLVAAKYGCRAMLRQLLSDSIQAIPGASPFCPHTSRNFEGLNCLGVALKYQQFDICDYVIERCFWYEEKPRCVNIEYRTMKSALNNLKLEHIYETDDKMESCVICMLVCDEVTKDLAYIVCPTCHVNYHPRCFSKWQYKRCCSAGEVGYTGTRRCAHCQLLLDRLIEEPKVKDIGEVNASLSPDNSSAVET